MEIDYGYACISTLNPELTCSQCATRRYLERLGPRAAEAYLRIKAERNIDHLRALLKANVARGIRAFRLPEQFLPQADLGYYDWRVYVPELQRIGRYCNAENIQLSQHPSQYFVLNSLRADVVDKTVVSLDLFADILAAFSVTRIPNLTLHAGVRSGYPNEAEACQGFSRNVPRLSAVTRSMLVVENDQKAFSSAACMRIHEATGLPIVFDAAHFKWNPGTWTFDRAVAASLSTWGSRTPKVHLSSEAGSRMHAHADGVTWPDYCELVEACQRTGLPRLCIIFECKAKDRAVVEILKRVVATR